MPIELPHFTGPLHSTQDMERLRDAVQGLLNMVGHNGIKVEFSGSTPVISIDIEQLEQFVPPRPIFYGYTQQMAGVSGRRAWRPASFDVSWSPGSNAVTDTFAVDGFYGHDFINGQAVQISTTGTLPNPLLPDTTYFVGARALLTTDVYKYFKLYDSREKGIAGGDDQIDFTTSGTGTHTFYTEGLARVDVKQCNRDGSQIGENTIQLTCHYNPDYDPNIRRGRVILWTTDDVGHRITLEGHEDGKIGRSYKLWVGTATSPSELTDEIPDGWQLALDVTGAATADKLIKGATNDLQLETDGGSLEHHHDFGTGSGGVADTILDAMENYAQILNETIDLPPWFAVYVIRRIN